MTNRREFLRTGVSVSALPLTNGWLSPDALARNEGDDVPLHTVIFDDRYAEARSVAESIGRFGVSLRSLESGDVTDLWYREPDLLERSPPSAIAGITQFGPMLVFEQLGKDRRMRMALRIEHRVRSDGTIAHVMTGPRETLTLAEQLRLERADWPALMAALLTHCRTDSSAPIERTLIVPAAKPMLQATTPQSSSARPESVVHYYMPQAIQEGHGVPWDGPLFSWVIAPAAPVFGRSASQHP